MVDDVVRVLLQGVVDSGFEIRLCSVLVDSQPSTDVLIAQARAGALQFDVDSAGFHHRGFDLANIGDLAAQVEVQELETILHAGGLELLERPQRFR